MQRMLGVVLLVGLSLGTAAEAQGPGGGRLRDLFGKTMTGQLRAGETRETLEWGGEQREYVVHRPPGFPGNRRWPLVLLFHGGTGNAGQALESYGMREAADRHGFVLVAPNGTGRTVLRVWNVQFGFGYAMQNQVDDVGFVRELVKRLEARYPLDARRVFATGISNGGILCHFLAAGIPSTFAAIAPVVGTVGGKAPGQADWQYPPSPSSPVAVIAFNGAKDDHIPVEGGRQRASFGEPVEVMSGLETSRFWVHADGCDPTPHTSEDEPHGSTVTRYTGGRAGTEVELWVVHDQGHAWPGGKAPRLKADPPSTLLDATETMWAFFERHPRR